LLDAVSKKCLSEALSPRVKADAILCTDGSAAIAATAKEMGVHHEAMNLSAGERVRRPWHIQNANACHGRLKGWMHRFRGGGHVVSGKLAGMVPRARPGQPQSGRVPSHAQTGLGARGSRLEGIII
jgi:hypothetical protein